MSNYYVLECIAPEDWDDPALVPGIGPPPGEASWRSGRRFLNPPAEPIELELHAEYGVQIKELRNVDALLVTRRLLGALRAAGVDNLDAYATVIRHPGRQFESAEYLACNLLGTVSGLTGDEDLEAGEHDGLIACGLRSQGIVLNNRDGLLLFRLAENSSAIMVHESLKDHLLSKGFTMLSFVPPEEWMG